MAMTKMEKRLAKRCRKLESEMRILLAINNLLMKCIDSIQASKSFLDRVNRKFDQASQQE